MRRKQRLQSIALEEARDKLRLSTSPRTSSKDDDEAEGRRCVMWRRHDLQPQKELLRRPQAGKVGGV